MQRGRAFVKSVNDASMGRSFPSVKLDFESSASANSATPATSKLKLRSWRRCSSVPDEAKRPQTSWQPERKISLSDSLLRRERRAIAAERAAGNGNGEVRYCKCAELVIGGRRVQSFIPVITRAQDRHSCHRP